MRIWCSTAVVLAFVGAVAPTWLPVSGASDPTTTIPRNLVRNAQFKQGNEDNKAPAHFTLTGDASWAYAGKRWETADYGVALESGLDLNGDGSLSGLVSQEIDGINAEASRWYRFSFRGLPEPNFAVRNDDLAMKVDFFTADGKSLDGVTQKIYPLIEQSRRDIDANGNHNVEGAATWKTYSHEFKLPFREIARLRLSVAFQNGAAKSRGDAAFLVSEFSLVPIPEPADMRQAAKSGGNSLPTIESLIHLGGRWYYAPDEKTTSRPERLLVTSENAHRLFYRDGRLSNPFAENMTAWLRRGFKDRHGKIVDEDRYLPDNVTLEFLNGETLIVRAKNLPNHPTRTFPALTGSGDRNPHFIQEQAQTYYLPLSPIKRAEPKAMSDGNANRALNMGPVGVAINGVAFFNPFDAGMTDAHDIMDRCCGHPAPGNLYHYHKYPVCVKSPFIDDGSNHSPLLGWALDGFPLYGPYESKGIMAKDLIDNKLNEFNLHYDEERGWHYHATPGKFPYLIGGYWGDVDARNRRGPGR